MEPGLATPKSQMRLATPLRIAYHDGMEVHLTPDVEKQLHDLAEQSGRPTDELLQDALAGYFTELAQTREMLNSRYDDLKSGRLQPLPGEDVEVYFRDKSAALRRPR